MYILLSIKMNGMKFLGLGRKNKRPSLVVLSNDCIKSVNEISSTNWYQTSKHKYSNLPALIKVRGNLLKANYWYLNNKLHNDTHPAVEITKYHEDKPFLQFWYKHGKLCRDVDDCGRAQPTVIYNCFADNATWYLYDTKATDDPLSYSLTIFDRITDIIRS